MGSLTAARPSEAYEIAGLQALQEASIHPGGNGIEDTLYPLLAISLLSECGGLNGEAPFARVMRIAAAIRSSESAASFLTRAAGGFARCTDAQSAADLMEAAALRRLATI